MKFISELAIPAGQCMLGSHRDKQTTPSDHVILIALRYPGHYSLSKTGTGTYDIPNDWKLKKQQNEILFVFLPRVEVTETLLNVLHQATACTDTINSAGALLDVCHSLY